MEQVGGPGGIKFSAGDGCYQGLSETTIALLPLEDLYRRIDRNMNKTNSFFDLKLSHAIKRQNHELREKSKQPTATACTSAAGAEPIGVTIE